MLNERRQLLSVAYGCLGSLAEAEDIVQEALLRFEQADRESIVNPEAWLTTVVTRLSIDRLRSAQHRRETYPGEWLPEPVYNAPTPEQEAITHSRLSVGLLYLLEKLEPQQRVVFILREVFEHSYRAISEIMGNSEAACRQLMVRARAALGRDREPQRVPQAVASTLVNRFIEALAQGDERELLAVVAPEAVLVGDGGGKAPSVLNPVYGAERILRFYLGIRNKHGALTNVAAVVNGGPGMLSYRDGRLVSVVSLEVEEGRIVGIYAVSNPEKLGAARD
jgi:RNA polymerase sigma-70 factor (ECF subfamily)